MTRTTIHLLCLAATSLSACSILTTVEPVSADIKTVCIRNNSLVHMAGFLPELRSQIEAKGIKTSVYSDKKPEECVHHLEYTANCGWDLAMYLTYTDLKIFENELLIGKATYNARGGGGRPDKFGTTAEKLRGLIDKLFQRKSTAPA